MSPKIPLTNPIASSIDVSGLNIDVGVAMAQTSSTSPIPNISVTPILLNHTYTQIYVLQGPESTPEISSKAKPQSKFPCDFLLNPVQNFMESQGPFGKGKQPSLNIPLGYEDHVGHEKQVDGRRKKRP
ncbi:hypothetical protein O181_090072 [Austropuccinia psidii MF-1]|uniref:Uncharacterized protein n=1 Tax=Austropuccinia psidii MF-1 TaxID=1389203 RepID=A0A9Q3P7B9_9BASI|nr:hypothetical protein [Austropuccinia psidii MF-1]